jgi:hypothetical protein
MVELTPEMKQSLAFSAKQELLRRYAREGDVLNWGKVLFPTKFKLPFCKELHQYLADIRYEVFTSTEAPRGFSKTTIKCFLVPLFIALNEPEKYHHYLNVQATSTKAISENIAIKSELETNELLLATYPILQSKEKWTEKQFVISIPKGNEVYEIVFTGVGAGESIRGINFKNKRPDYIIVDDLYNDDDIYSPKAVLKKNNWFWGTLYNAIDETKPNSLHLQGTAISKSDLLATCRDTKQVVGALGKLVNIKSKTFQAIKNEETKEVLWGEFMTYEKLMAKKELMGSIIFNRELQNNRRDDESSTIKEYWLKFHDRIPEGSRIVAKIGACDPSIGENENNDFTSIGAVYATEIPDSRAWDYWIEEVVNEHLSMNQRVLKYDNMNERHHYTVCPVEGIAGFRDFVAELKRRTSLPVKLISSVKNKQANRDRESAKFEAGRVSINRNIPQHIKNQIIEQLLNNNPDHDDISDMIFLSLNTQITSKVTCTQC